MRLRNGYWLPAGLLLAVWLLLSVPRTEAGRVSCESVISEVNRETRTTKAPNADLSKVARHLGTSVAWTEHCMWTYGRRPKRPGREAAESREVELENLEEDEPEERMPEDKEEAGAPDLKVRPDEETELKIHPPPTVKPGLEADEGYGLGPRQ
jgi:hypothetical protein